MAGVVAAAGPGPGPGPAPIWPALRQELRLLRAPHGLYGEPSWTLHDPAAQRFFRLGWLEVEILIRWHMGDPEAIARSITSETTLSPHPARVEQVKNFFIQNNLVNASTPEDTQRLAHQRHGKKPSILQMALKNYLFIRIPLVRPDAFLGRTMGLVSWLFSRTAVTVFAVLAVFGFYLISREWSSFRDSFASLTTFTGGMLALLALGVTKAFHELGHAYAARRLGLRVPNMGISLMCFAPVLWTDTTEVWKLQRRRERILVGVSGVYFELILAIGASFLWPLLPPGPLKTVAFITAGSAWVMTLFLNINPCMRYDGYYILSDWWNIPGLQTRSFALAKWWLRERLFGFGLDAPEPFLARHRFKLIIYAYAAWIYRLFLFLGIALMVYHLFFKALGAVLMLVELVFFIGLPILMEIRTWITMRKNFSLNIPLVRTAIVAVVLLFMAVYPWHNRVECPAILYREHQAGFFSQIGARVEAVLVENGQTVQKDDVLFVLQSPDLDARIEIARQKLAIQRHKLSYASLNAELRAEMAAEWDELERLAEDLGGMLARKNELTLRAPFAGTVYDVPESLNPGSWLEAKERLGVVTSGGHVVEAFVHESDWNRLTTGRAGKFYPSGTGWEPVTLEIVAIDSQALAEVTQPELASPMGGPLAVYREANGRLVPEQAVYRVVCRATGPINTAELATGFATLEGEPRSLAAILWTNFLGILVRESGL